ncbi:TIGR03943 family putative permease subunit [Mycobacterium montefiorense]|uniref:TIGR03943 family protein n=1 Tax=Mycobacterium montefiorense TaxID=154654 RepID=A0AA37UUL5_9MYCO|nr:TIGR03943 family protein [Mycobacterium montefiorense]GBG40046.1 TIGR03943 family protein [Mycobacterium montefiorense]GKU33594.1 TIGR03943 family protein [Mycobacterium montefiorense]GKU39532.1 TIGR03943 family protein [Mycobacterium montefiorense]GKU43808.1 TIGR03943 family protein [Mycobacterium montefiorense]GKU52700.1 TIGR03943 family protein [Mycobacterium montefiorense]
MKRETENTILLLVGLSIALIVGTGVFTRYVKPSLLPWLVLTAALLIGLALVAIVGDVRRGGSDHGPEDGHAHRGGVVWLLAVPIVVLCFVTPPALRPQAATGSVTNVSNDVLRQAFPPLPPGRAPEISLAEVMMRAANDSTGSLNNRLITVTGFTLNEPGGIDLARVVIICCAADAQLAHVHLRDRDGASTFGFPDNTWLRVEGVVTPAERQPHTPPIPTLRAVSVTPVSAPANPYS